MTLLAIEVILTKMDDLESADRDHYIAWCDLKDWLEELDDRSTTTDDGDEDWDLGWMEDYSVGSEDNP